MTQTRVVLRRGAVFAGVAAAALGVLWLLRAPAQRVEIGQATRGPLVVTVDEEGTTRVRQRYGVAAPVSGRLLRLALDEGDAVAEGDVVVRLDPAPLDARTLQQARARRDAAADAERQAAARVAQVHALRAQAVRERERARRLAAAGTLSAQAREAAELELTSRSRELEAADFAARSAAHEAEVAEAALLAAGGETGSGRPTVLEVRAPSSGRVLRVFEESERVVAVGTPLLEIGDPGDLEVVVDLLSTDAVRVAPGAAVALEDWGGRAPLGGRVRRVEPSGFTKISALGVEEQRVNVIVDLVERPPEGFVLGDGYRLEARIVVWQTDDALQVPSSALFRRDGVWHVFRVEGGRARLRGVEVGERSASDAEVKAGLEAGDEVVLYPSDRVEEGVRVEPL